MVTMLKTKLGAVTYSKCKILNKALAMNYNATMSI